MAAVIALIAAFAVVLAPAVASGGIQGPPQLQKPEVTKTAYAKWVKKIDWEIEKTLRIKNNEYADRQNWQIFWGDSVWANYRIDIRKKIEHKYSVHGTIRIPLVLLQNAIFTGDIYVKDVIYLESGKKIEVPYESMRCEGYEKAPQTVDYRGELVCHYWVYLDKPEHGKNVVYVWNKHYGYDVAYKAEAPFWFEKEPTKVVGHKRVWLHDTNMPDEHQGPYYRSERIDYPKHFECNDKENPFWHTNTAKLLVPLNGDNADVVATFVDGGYKEIARDSARLHLECFGLKVKKEGEGKFKRLFRWKISKEASIDKKTKIDRIELANSKDASKKGPREVTVTYTVKVDAWADDLGYGAKGTITIRNEHPKRVAEIVSVKDTILTKGEDPIPAKVSCESDKKGAELGLPATISPGETLTCLWHAKLPDGSPRKNRAEVEQQNYHREIGRRAKPEGTTWYRAYAPITFPKAPWKLIDETVELRDPLAPKKALGTIDRKDTPKTIRYEVVVKPGHLAPRCGKGTLKNTASLKPADTRIKYEASVSIPVHVTCDDPKKDPPPKVDPRKVDPPKKDPPKTDPPKKDHPIVCEPAKGKPWHLIGSKGIKTLFYDSGMTFKKVIKKSRGKSPHYRLARAYIYAQLSILAGADYGKNVERAKRWAERYFDSHSANDSNVKRAPNAAKAKKLRKAMKNKKRVLIRFNKHAETPSCHIK